MRRLPWISTLCAVFALTLTACDDPGPSDTGGDATEGATESTTQGTDPTADGSTGDGPTACEDPNPAGCVDDGCGDGEICSLETEECVPSSCACNEGNGQWDCTADCGGGVCIPEPDSGVCEGDNPAGCATTGCDEGEVCSMETEACIPSACNCDAESGSWNCTADCGGGECVASDDSMTGCPGPNPADLCPEDPEACIPSGCECDQDAMVWNCTPDCSGGTRC